MKRKLLALLLVLVGLSFICYPTARDMYYEYQQRKITADWLANLEQLDTEPAQTSEENEASEAAYSGNRSDQRNGRFTDY